MRFRIFFKRGRRLLYQRVTDAQSAAPRVGGSANNPSSFGIGAEPGHQEHRSPSTSVPTEASGCRSTVRRSIARLVPQPGQKTSSQGVPASSAARIVGDHSMSRPVAKRRFQRSTTSSASRRAARSALSLAAPALMSSPRVRTPISQSARDQEYEFSPRVEPVERELGVQLLDEREDYAHSEAPCGAQLKSRG
jgi:hypothetical protein